MKKIYKTTTTRTCWKQLSFFLELVENKFRLRSCKNFTNLHYTNNVFCLIKSSEEKRWNGWLISVADHFNIGIQSDRRQIMMPKNRTLHILLLVGFISLHSIGRQTFHRQYYTNSWISWFSFKIISKLKFKRYVDIFGCMAWRLFWRNSVDFMYRLWK